MQTNRIPRTALSFTHEGAVAATHVSVENQLRRSVLSCLLWEDSFYESGQSITDRIESLCERVHPSTLAALALEARTKFHLRHVPLLLVAQLAKRGGKIVSETLAGVIQRPDELSEFLAVYWRNGKSPLSKQVKLGLGEAFKKFDAFGLAKYNRPREIKLRDVLFLTHPKPLDEAQARTWKQLVDGTLPTPDTWETELSAGKDKKATFERLIREGKIGYLALLRNLRNMMDAGCDQQLVEGAVLARRGAQRVLPFRYVAAARACPRLERAIDTALIATIKELPKLQGRTTVLVDVSGSMDAPLSSKSDMTRVDAACALASLIDGNVRVFSFSNNIQEVPHRLGMSGVDAIRNSQSHCGTNLGSAIAWLNSNVECERLIVITDEQSHDRVGRSVSPMAYMINVASYKNGVGYGAWTHLDGFSEGILRFIHESEG